MLTQPPPRTANPQVAIRLPSGAKTALTPDFKRAFAYAHPFLKITGDVIIAWMLLWRATVAAPRLAALLADVDAAARPDAIAKNKNAAFYQAQMQTADYYIKTLLPETLGKMEAVLDGSDAMVTMDDRCFGGL